MRRSTWVEVGSRQTEDDTSLHLHAPLRPTARGLCGDRLALWEIGTDSAICCEGDVPSEPEATRDMCNFTLPVPNRQEPCQPEIFLSQFGNFR